MVKKSFSTMDLPTIRSVMGLFKKKNKEAPFKVGDYVRFHVKSYDEILGYERIGLIKEVSGNLCRVKYSGLYGVFDTSELKLCSDDFQEYAKDNKLFV